MSTQLPQPGEDLDRTDELPRLDIAAYEASLARASEDPLSRTDTWAVRALQEGDFPESPEEDSRPRLHAVAEPSVRLREREPAPDITTEVDRIFSRIGQLETELAAARADTAQWQAHCAELTTERAEQEERTVTLAGNNARLVEQQQIAYDRLQLLEARLREETELSRTRIGELVSALESERAGHLQARQQLDQESTEARNRIAALEVGNERLQNALREQTSLATERRQSIEGLQASVADQQKAAGDMARLLAMKLAQYDTLEDVLMQRDAALRALEEHRTDLERQLSAMTAAEHTRSSELRQVGRELEAAREVQQQRDRVIADRDQRLSQLTAQIEQLQTDLFATSKHRDATLGELAAEREQHRQAQERGIALAQQVEQLQGSLHAVSAQLGAREVELTEAGRSLAERQAQIVHHEQQGAEQAQSAHALRGELTKALEHVVQLVAQRDGLAAEREELAAKLSDLSSTLQSREAAWAQTQAASTSLTEELERSRTLAAQQAEALQLAQEAVADLRAGGESMEQQIKHASEQAQRWETQSQEQTRALEAHALELAATRAEVGRQTRAHEDLERAVRVRDELLHTLRQELQSAQDERGIVAGQLEKARARTKSLAERIFQKDARISTLRADLAVHTEALAAIRRDITSGGLHGATEPEQILEPLDHDAPVIVLNRKVMTVGRTDENDVCVPSKLVSRHHARLLVGPNAVIIEDAGSTNGCYVNERSVKKHLLRDGDVLLIGDRRFRLATRVRPALLQ
jgi:chromosome segregation ATPase